MPKNEKFEIQGVDHLALVCKDMKRTVDFYCGKLGMPLTKTIDLPEGMGQHFFFDIGNGDMLAFFWFPDAPDSQPKLVEAGIDATEVVNHDDSETQASPELTDTTFVRSVYFKDPDGILLEFAAWTRELDERDVNAEPMSVSA